VGLSGADGTYPLQFLRAACPSRMRLQIIAAIFTCPYNDFSDK
jgi:hypothetical protein